MKYAAVLLIVCANLSAYVLEDSATASANSLKNVMKASGRIGWRIVGDAPAILRESVQFATKSWADNASGSLAFIEDPNDAQIDIVWLTTYSATVDAYLAYTYVTSDGSVGAFHAKIIVNANRFTFHRDPANDGCSGQTANLDSVILHEWGHVLGLGHADDKASSIVGEWGPSNLPTMWSTIQPGCSTLHEDDIAGLHALYDGKAPEAIAITATSSIRSGDLLPNRKITFSTADSGMARWDFGDGTSVVTDASSVDHKFSSVGTYTITIERNGLKGALSLEVAKQKHRSIKKSRRGEGLLPTPSNEGSF